MSNGLQTKSSKCLELAAGATLWSSTRAVAEWQGDNMGGGCSTNNELLDTQARMVRSVHEQLSFFRRVIADMCGQAGLGEDYSEALIELVADSLETTCDIIPTCLTLEELSDLDEQLLGTGLHTAHAVQIDLPKLLQFVQRIVGMPSMLKSLRKLIIPQLERAAGVLHASRATESVTLCFFESCWVHSMECTLRTGFLPMQLAIGDLEAAAQAKDSEAVRKEVNNFALLLLDGDKEEVQELKRRAVFEAIEPAITLCHEEFDVFQRYITMMCISADVSYAKGSAQWLHFFSVVSQLHKCRNMGDVQDRIKWISEQVVGIQVIEKLIKDTSIEEAVIRAKDSLQLDALDKQLLDAIQYNSTKFVIQHQSPELCEKLRKLERVKILNKGSKEALPKAIVTLAEEVCGERMVASMVAKASTGFRESATGIVLKWNTRTKNTKKNPKLVASESIAVMAMAAAVAQRNARPEVANAILKIPDLTRATEVEEEVKNTAIALLGEDRCPDSC